MTQDLNDPVFAVIERCLRADKEFEIVSIVTDEVAANLEGRSITQTDLYRWEAASDQIDEAVAALVSTTPTTIAGLAAAVEWLLKYEEGSVPSKTAQFLRTLTTERAIYRLANP